MKTLNAADQASVASAVCDSSSVNPLSGSAGQWAFGGLEVDDTVPFYCPHPYAPNFLALKTSSFHGNDVAHCNTLYSELIAPHHLAACLTYIGLSLAFAGLYLRFTLIMDRKRDPHMKVSGKTKPMQKVYLFGVLAALANALACVDMKGWAGIYTLPVQQVFVELSGGFLHCALFILMTMWISISQTRNSVWRTLWLERLQYGCGALSVIAGCVLGYLEWSWSSDPKRGSKNGSLTAAKHLSLGLMEVIYSAAGTFMALQLLRRIRKSSQGVDLNAGGRGRSGSSVGVLKMRQLQKISNTITSYLCAVSVMVVGMVWYRVDKAMSSWGEETYRYPPCSSFSAYVSHSVSFFIFSPANHQLSHLFLSGVFQSHHNPSFLIDLCLCWRSFCLRKRSSHQSGRLFPLPGA
jgi:hypothetical protein